MNRYETHALDEFRAAGWIDSDGKYKDEMQEMICNHVMELLKVFHGEGHSGSSAHYAVNMFKSLAMFEPLVPLTGEDWEWVDVAKEMGYTLWQNKRASHVFKTEEGAYDNNGIVFYDWYTDDSGEKFKSYFTCKESRVPVTFPYTPKTEYKERIEMEE